MSIVKLARPEASLLAQDTLLLKPPHFGADEWPWQARKTFLLLFRLEILFRLGDSLGEIETLDRELRHFTPR